MAEIFLYNYIACIKLVSLKLMNGFAIVTQLLLMQKWVVFTSKTTHFHFETKHSAGSFCIDCIFYIIC